MARPSKVPKPLQPMLATLIDAPFDDPEWVFESEWDGFRLVASIENRQRHALFAQWLDRQRQLQADRQGPGEGLKKHAVIDGELVALDERRRFPLPAFCRTPSRGAELEPSNPLVHRIKRGKSCRVEW